MGVIIVIAALVVVALAVLHDLGRRFFADRADARIKAAHAMEARMAALEASSLDQHKRLIETSKKVDATLAARIRR